MSAVLPAPRPAVAAPRAAVIAMAAGCAALTARPLILDVVGGRPAAVVTVLFGSLLAVSVLWPGRTSGSARATSFRAALPVLAIGVGAFAVGRALLSGSPPPAPATAFVVALNTLAAVAEEAFFRRLVYGALLAAGPVAALVGSAALFAAVHVTIYGFWVLPLDFAAGLLFGWQRQVTGSWAVPALTHAAANVLVVL
jgi:membrane protease YdiL (CAAX protease family)